MDLMRKRAFETRKSTIFEFSKRKSSASTTLAQVPQGQLFKQIVDEFNVDNIPY